MKKEIWPNVLMLIGFSAAVVLLGLHFFVRLSPSVNLAENIGESIAIGIGSVGLGGRITESRRKNQK